MIARMSRAIAICVVVAFALLAAGARPAFAQDAAIYLIPSGYGKITIDDGSADSCGSADLANGCIVSRPIGSTVRFTATTEGVTGPQSGDPDPNVASKFVGWSRPECEGTAPTCTITVEDEVEPVVAQFTPVWLEVLINGDGTVAVNGQPFSSCTTGRCVIGYFDNGATVNVTSVTADPHWGFGCDPFESDLLAGRCSIELSNIRNFVSVGFGVGFEPDAQPPYNLSKPVTVRRAGRGEGRVHGNGRDAEGVDWQISCGSTCKLNGIQYQTRVRLSADVADGSTFDHWSGPPCGSRTVCTFTAGKYPSVRATFDRTASVASVSPPASSAPASGTGAAPFSMSVRRVKASGRRATRKITVTLTTNRSARATLRLTRKGKRVTAKTFTLPQGTRAISLKVPRRARAGSYRISLGVTAADGTVKSFAKRLHLRR
jgi:hypothetical protein